MTQQNKEALEAWKTACAKEGYFSDAFGVPTAVISQFAASLTTVQKPVSIDHIPDVTKMVGNKGEAFLSCVDEIIGHIENIHQYRDDMQLFQCGGEIIKSTLALKEIRERIYGLAQSALSPVDAPRGEVEYNDGVLLRDRAELLRDMDALSWQDSDGQWNFATAEECEGFFRAYYQTIRAAFAPHVPMPEVEESIRLLSAHFRDEDGTVEGWVRPALKAAELYTQSHLSPASTPRPVEDDFVYFWARPWEGDDSDIGQFIMESTLDNEPPSDNPNWFRLYAAQPDTASTRQEKVE